MEYFLIVRNHVVYDNRRRVSPSGDPANYFIRAVPRAMKKGIYLLLIIALSAGCSKSKEIQFCEGVSPKGEGVNCGARFYEGELTAVINADEPFGVKTISVQVYEVKDKKMEKIETISVDVKPDDQTAPVNLSLYSGGTYTVRAFKNDVRIGEGQISIRER
jgi:hypothetical protein